MGMPGARRAPLEPEARTGNRSDRIGSFFHKGWVSERGRAPHAFRSLACVGIDRDHGGAPREPRPAAPYRKGA